MAMVYLQMQRNLSSLNLTQNQVVTFDTILEKSDYVEASLDGHFSLKKAGVYFVAWNVAITSHGGLYAMIGLKDISGKIIMGHSAGSEGEITGSGLITITDVEEPNDFCLSTGTFSVTVQNGDAAVNLVVYGVSEESQKLTVPFTCGIDNWMLPAIDETGVLTNVGVFANGIALQYPEFHSVEDGKYISIPFGSTFIKYLYSFPYNVRLVAGSAIFSNLFSVVFDQDTTNISPFVGIAIQDANDNERYEIMEASMIYPEDGYRDLNVPSSAIQAYTADLDLMIPAGKIFSIVCGFISLGETTEAYSSELYIQGSLIFDIIELKQDESEEAAN